MPEELSNLEVEILKVIANNSSFTLLQIIELYHKFDSIDRLVVEIQNYKLSSTVKDASEFL